jgi:hypothetical protein
MLTRTGFMCLKTEKPFSFVNFPVEIVSRFLSCGQ